MSLVTALSFSCVFLFIILSVSVYFNIKHGVLILKIQDSIENSLDTLDEKYKSITKILDMPLFFDSVEVRQVISDIRDSRDTILIVANDLAGPLNVEEKEIPDDDQKS
jgi:hypothetical protein